VVEVVVVVTAAAVLLVWVVSKKLYNFEKVYKFIQKTCTVF
jgi:hypothetical protein